ncbi:MAG: patatin-like phospholipase family protein [Gallionellaceae bacterium]|jgi:NTE family protein
MDVPQKTGLILTGGGARAAYQVGVLKALAEILPRRTPNPFPIICGTSAGAFNAVTLAVYAQSFRLGVQYLEKMWKNFTAHDIYRADALGVFNNTMRWLSGLLLNALGINKLNHVSLLDSSPLAALLDRAMPSEKIQENIDLGVLHALSISASGYGTGHSVNFFQSAPGVQPWKRARRLGLPTNIEAKHILASSAIPFIFPAVLINREYFGDGSMRQIAPVSPALHLGAVRVLVIGTGQVSEDQAGRSKVDDYPSLAKIAGHAMDSIFLDSLEVDIERLNRINKTIDLVSPEVRQHLCLHHIDVLQISPSQSIEKIAGRYAKQLPFPIRLLLRTVGAMRRNASNLVSYLLFEKDFCRALIDLGYQDAMNRKDEIVAFLGISAESMADESAS